MEFQWHLYGEVQMHVCLPHVIPARLHSLLSSRIFYQECRSAAGGAAYRSHPSKGTCKAASLLLCVPLLSLPLAGSHYRPPWPSVVLLARRIACLLLKPLSMPGFLEKAYFIIAQGSASQLDVNSQAVSNSKDLCCFMQLRSCPRSWYRAHLTS